MKNSSDQWQVDDELLTETGRGGLFTDGYLQGQPLVSYLDTSETPLFVFGSGKRGITHEGQDGATEFAPASGYRVIIALTDRRIQFVVGGGASDGDWAADVHLSNIDAVDVEEGLIREELTVETDEDAWHMPLKDVDTGRLVEFLEDISWAWIRVTRLLDETRKHLTATTRRQEAREYETAHEELEAATDCLEEAAGITQSLAEEATAGMRERITQVEGRYRETRRRTHASEAAHIVDQAEHHWRENEYELAYEAYARARSSYEAALDIEGLAPEKTAEMRERVEHVDRSLDHLKTAPLRQAAQVRRRALDAADPADQLDAWTEAISRYRTVLELDWGRDDRRFAGDVDRCRDRIAEAVEGVLDARGELAADSRNRGDALAEDGDLSEARDRYEAATTQMEESLQLARELAPERRDAIRNRLDDLEDRLYDLDDQVEDGEHSRSATAEDEQDPETGEGESEASAGVSGDAGPTAQPDGDQTVFESTGFEQPTVGTDDTQSSFDPADVEGPVGQASTPESGAADSTDDDPGGWDDVWAGAVSAGDAAEPGDAGDGDARENVEATTDAAAPDDRSQEDGYNDFDNWVTLATEEAAATVPDDGSDASDLVGTVESLTPRALASVATAVWEERGWTTDETEAGGVVVATRENPHERRVLLTAESATTDTVDRAREYRTRFDADGAILFVTETTDDDPELPGVTLYDAASTASLVEATDLVSLLRNVHV